MKLGEAFAEKLADSAVAEGLADALYATAPSPVGRLLVVVSDAGVCRIGFAEEDIESSLAEVAARIGPRILHSQRHTEAVTAALEAFFEGDPGALDVPVDMTLVRSDFQRSVLDALRSVGTGQVTTYGRLAATIGHPGAARAVGTALGRNPIPIVVPCHRVLPASGGVGGYGGGPERKRFLLRLEGASPEALLS